MVVKLTGLKLVSPIKAVALGPVGASLSLNMYMNQLTVCKVEE